MALHAALVWLLVAVCCLTYALLVAELIGIVRRGLALKSRAEKLADHPLLGALTKAEAGLDRIAGAGLEIQALVMRAIWAIARIRATVHAVAGVLRAVVGR